MSKRKAKTTSLAVRGGDLHKQLLSLPRHEQMMFMVELFGDKESFVGEFIHNVMTLAGERQKKYQKELADKIEWIDLASGLQKRLNKHRKPRRNAQRDAEIMRLANEGKSAGQILLTLKENYPILKTPSHITSIIAKMRKRGMHIS